MTIPDITSILNNLSQSLVPVQYLLRGFSYILGLIFFFIAIGKLRHIAEQQGRSQEGHFPVLVYIAMGAALLFLPSTLKTLSNTVFGPSSVISYTTTQPISIYTAIKILVQTAGLIWFIRGCVLLTQSSQSGKQHGPKGLVFVCAGVLAVNFEGTMASMNTLVSSIVKTTLSLKTSQGF